MTGEPETAVEVVTRYLEGIVAHDWETVFSCLAPAIVRVGPFGDTYSGTESYLEFLSNLMPTLQEYSMRVDRVEAKGRFCVAELTETMTIGGNEVVTPEALVFDLDADGRITHIAIYIQTRADLVGTL